MTDLSAKFAALQAQLDTQHTALLTAITTLRGAGPENTLKSVNESLWAIAGAAPGATLVELLAAIQAGPTAGADPNIAAILAAIGTLASTPAGETVKTLLAQIDTDIAGISETPPDYSAAAPPAGGCGGGYSETDYIQLSGWEITSNPARYTATFYDMVGFISLASALIEVADGNTYNALIDTAAGGITEFCATWEASGASPMPVMWRKYTLGGGGVYNPILTDIDMTGGSASGSAEMLLDQQAIVFFVDYGEDPPADPGINLWLKGYGAS